MFLSHEKDRESFFDWIWKKPMAFSKELRLVSCWLPPGQRELCTGKRRRFRLMLPPYLSFPIREYVEFCGKEFSIFFLLLGLFSGEGPAPNQIKRNVVRKPHKSRIRYGPKRGISSRSSLLDQQLEEPN